MGDSIERMLEFYAVVKLESDADEDEGGEDGVELETVWVVVRCVDGSVKTCYEFVFLCSCDERAEVGTVEVHMGVGRCGSFASCP